MQDKPKEGVVAAAPVFIGRRGEDRLVVRWNDDSQSEYAFFDLRVLCPCANCVNEWTGDRTLDASAVAKDIRPHRIYSVGRYAMGIQWSDGHATGLYSYQYLKGLPNQSK